MPRRMKLHPVDAVAKTVMGLQFGDVAIRLAGQFLNPVVPGKTANGGTLGCGPRRFTFDGCFQHHIVAKRIESCRHGRLVFNDVG